MRLRILGIHSDDRGSQLETITKELLESLGFTRLKLNKANTAGEIDVEGEFVTKLPVEDKRSTLIAECKAYKDPLNTPDWLKFLGKIYVAEDQGQDVYGCLVALSGVNGPVQGSYDGLRRKNVRLVGGPTIVEYLAKSHGLADTSSLLGYLKSAGLTHLSIELAYYQRRVYWVLLFDGGRYSILNADVTHPDQPTLDLVKPLLEAVLEVSAYIDVRDEKQAVLVRKVARKSVLSAVMVGGGQTTLADAIVLVGKNRYSADIPTAVVRSAADDLVSGGVLMAGGDGTLSFPPTVDTDPAALSAVLLDFGDEMFLTMPLGSSWWDQHIDGRLVDYACQVQVGLELDESDKAKAATIMRISPTAVIYALKPDPMIVTHHTDPKVNNENFSRFDRNRFMRSLYGAMYSDFRNRNLAQYMLKTRNIETVERNIQIAVFDREGNLVLEDKIDDVSLLGEWYETDANGDPIFIYVAGLPGYAERRRIELAIKADSLETGAEAEATPSPAVGPVTDTGKVEFFPV